MKLNNKKIIAILLAAATLTACDSLSGNKKEEEKPVDTKVEESAENKADQTTEVEGEEKAAEEKDADKEEASDEDTKDGEDAKTDEAVTDEGKSAKEKLEDAVFKTRVTARAAELLIEQTPETITGIREDLEELLQQSQEQIDKANELLESM